MINYFYGTTVTNGFPGSWVLKLGTTPAQEPRGRLLTTNFPAQAIGYPGIAYMARIPRRTSLQLRMRSSSATR